MATTTNYSWTTPDDTDLVKDGAAAIRTLGSSADTTVKNLNPGTTAGDIDYYTSSTAKARIAIGTAGQVLKVNAGGTAPEWGTTADQTPLTTKGDLFTFDTADARLGVGANGTVLTADSAETTGLKWATPSAPSFVGCNIYRSGNVTIPNATSTAIEYNAEVFDTDAFHDNSTNPSRITIPAGKGGKYLFTAWNSFASNGTGYRNMDMFINGTTLTGSASIGWTPNATGNVASTIAVILDLVASDYVEVFVTQTSGGNLNLVGNIYGATGLSCVYLGA